MKVAIAQPDPIVGDVQGNLACIVSTLSSLSSSPSDLLVFPELFLSGYPPKDLLERSWFIEKIERAIQEIVKVSRLYPRTGILFGAPLPTRKPLGRDLFNTALLVHRGEILLRQNKSLLPTYDVFDEKRYFEPATEVHTVPFMGETLGISICEDYWNEPEIWPRGTIYDFDPIDALAKKGATLFVNLSASPFSMGKEELRYRLIRNHCLKHHLPFVFVNQVGGNDDLIFDGRSMCLDRDGEAIFIGAPFRKSLDTIDMSLPGRPGLYVPQDKVEAVYEALVLGIRDYIRKCGFSKTVVGLSGGIDSAVTCCLAREAIGRGNVLSLSMPSPYSSKGSIKDARLLAERTGIELKVRTHIGNLCGLPEGVGACFCRKSAGRDRREHPGKNTREYPHGPFQ